MAKKPHDSALTITTPTRFGSHKSMVIEELEDGRVVCKDDSHTYITTKDRLDNGMADPKRYS